MRKNTTNFNEDRFRSTDSESLQADDNSISLTKWFWVSFTLSLIAELIFVPCMYIWSINNASWQIDAYITTSGAIGVVAIPVAIFIGTFIWQK